MKRRYLFHSGDSKYPSGGIAVIYDMVELLRRLGYDASVVHADPYQKYQYSSVSVPVFYSPRMRHVFMKYGGIRNRIKSFFNLSNYKNDLMKKIDERDTDFLISPEFCFDMAMEAYSPRRIGVFVQNPFALQRAFCRALDRGMDPIRDVDMWLSIADVCDRTLEMIGARTVHRFPVSMRPHLFSPAGPKKRLITYMPRKRPIDAQVIAHALKTRQMIGNYEIRALHNMPPAEIQTALSESRIFISLLKEEALGFPAAEAMAAGCIVIGFDGLGVEEYFDETTGIPVKDGDVARLVFEVERVVAELDIDPTRFDAMTQRAGRVVRERYGTDVFEARVAELWKTF